MRSDEAIMSERGPVTYRTNYERLKSEFCEAYFRYFQALDKPVRPWRESEELWADYIRAREAWIHSPGNY